MSSAYIKCMANKGFTATITGPAGEGTVDAGEESFEAEAECNADLSVIATLRGAILRNPDHRDEEEIVAACLVDKKVAPPGYSKRDYGADLQAQKFPYSIENPGFSTCVNDPLGLASGK
ncbi:Lipoprotein OS=Leifsonia shinshuensis OX=150026 GN=HNR13_001374 PE=4 SV=1 [Leifsonia shinshuensis]